MTDAVGALPTRPFDADAFALLTSLPPAEAAQVRSLIRERDHLYLLHEALIQVELAPTMEARLRVCADAVRGVGFERVVVVLRDEDGDPVLRVSSGLDAVEQVAIGLMDDSGAAWRRREEMLAARRVSESFYLRADDPWAAGELPVLSAGAAGAPAFADVLVVPLRAPGGRLAATLLLPAPADGARPSMGRVRTVELFGRQVVARIEQERLATLARRRLERLQRLQQLGGALARSLDEREVVVELARGVSRLVPCDGVVVVRPDLEAGTSEVLLHLADGEERTGGLAQVGPGVVAEVARTGRLVRVAGRTAASESDSMLSPGRQPASVLAVPLMAGIRLLGVLAVYADAVGAYGTEDEETLATVAAQAASALSNARLYDESERERRMSEALAEVARAVGESLRTGEVMRLILRHASSLLRAEGAVVGLRSGEYVHLVAGVGIADVLAGMHLPLTDPLAGPVVREGRVVIANDLDGRDDLHRPLLDLVAVQNVVAVPFVTRQGPIGGLCVFNRGADFDERDARVLQRLADQVTVAIVNARLYEEVAEAGREWTVAFNSIASGMCLLDEAGRIARYNERAVHLADPRPHRELVGRRFYEAVLHEPREVADGCPLDQALNQCVVGRATLRSATRAKEFEVVAAPHPNGGAVVTFDDVTHERARAAALRQSEARYENVVESASDAIFTLDEEGYLTSVNQALERAVGRPREQLVGEHFTALIDPRDRDAVWGVFASTLHGSRERHDLRYLDAMGVPRAASMLSSPIVENGLVSAVLCVVRDVSEERMLVEQLLQQEKLAAIGQLVSGVAHELNNPLASVMAFAQLLLSEGAEGDVGEGLRTIHDEAKRAAKIVSNLLTFARQHPPQRMRTSVNEVMLTTLELRRYALTVHGVELVEELDPDVPVTWADPFQLQQVFLNLLSNAEHALADWTGPKRISIRTWCEAGVIRVRVEDSGPGIAAREVDRIFNPFYTTKGVGKGTGLGLSISDGIVREHGGRITVSSAPGSGAVFEIELPHTTLPGAQRTLGEPEPPQLAEGTKTVLVVDDEAAIRTAIGRYLGELGHRVDAVGSGLEALARLEAQRYDVVLLDLRMPDMPGDRLFEELRARDAEQAARVVFITGDVQNDRARDFIAATGRPSIGKPFMFDELARAIFAQPEAKDGAKPEATWPTS